MPDRPVTSPALTELQRFNLQGRNLGQQRRLRPAATTALPTIDNTANLAKGVHLGAEGTVTFFLGRTADAIARVTKAVSSGDAAAINAIVKEVKAPLRQQPANLAAAYDMIAAAPVFVAILYGGTTLIDDLMMPAGRDLIAITLPYIGGRLAAGGLQLRQWQQSGAQPLHGAAILTAPKLTPAEIAALQRLTDNEAWRNIGTHNDCDVACGAAAFSGAVDGAVAGAEAGAAVGALTGPVGAAVGGAVGAVAGAFVGGALAYGAYNKIANAMGGGMAINQADAERMLRTMQLSDADVAKLGSQGTAAALMELRRIALQQSAK